jgi:probable F420-dependent oxidoreductase
VAGAAPLPDYYWRSHDQFVALAAAAAVTSTLKLATGITLVAQRDPLWLAKEVASLDLISGGRVLFGIGYGWNKEEMADHGLRYTERRAVLRENILAMQELWTKDEAEFHGDHVDFEPSWSWPKPVQKPHPPVILGGAAGPKTIEHIVEFCDGWMPIAGRHSFGDRLDDLRLAAEQAGRDPASIELGLFMAPPDARSLEPLAASGIARAVLGLPQGPPEQVLEALDSFVALLDVVGG